MAKNIRITPYRITNPSKFRLSQTDPDDTGSLKSKKAATELLQKSVQELKELQEVMYAQDKWSVLLIFQAMDAAGKDGTIKHVMSGINPQGCQVFSFKAPSAKELDHDFLWRTTRCMPERGRIGIFNRSYYEETLVVRVHPEYLKGQRLPAACVPRNLNTIWKQRYESINDLEKHMARNGTLVLKFFLNVSHKEQAERFLSRLERPEKNWKFSEGDLAERKHWKKYMKAYEEMIRSTSTRHGRWHVIPADHKWYARLVVSQTIIQAMRKLDLEYPKVSKQRKEELVSFQDQLKKEIERL